MSDSDIEKDIEEFRNLTVKLFQTSFEHKAHIISQHCTNIGAMLALVAPNESALLDTIDAAHKHIRTHAAEVFVANQKMRKG